MSDVMTFPATFEEFAKTYKIVDREQVYTNGTELIPIFRVEQWLEHTSSLNQSEMRGMMNYCQNQIEKAKAEAIKEFAESLKEKGIKVQGGSGFEGVTTMTTNVQIDNLVKKMVGEE